MLPLLPGRIYQAGHNNLCSPSQSAKAGNDLLLPVHSESCSGRRKRRSDRRLCDSAALVPRFASGCLKVSQLRSGVPVFAVAMADPENDLARQERVSSRKQLPLEVGGFSIEGISIGGHETCVMIPGMKVAFDIGRCPQRAISQDFLFISHAHLDHIGGIAAYVATRGLYRMKPPTVIIPACIKPAVEKLIQVYRELDGSQLDLNLVGLDVGEEYDMGKGYVVKPFRTYHGVPSQGYVIYSVKKKLKAEYLQLSGPEIKDLKFSGVEIINTTKVPVVAFTGDTTADFITDKANSDVLIADLLIMEATFVDDAISVAHARDYGHVHLSEVAELSEKFQNKNILFIHFSARYESEEIVKAIKNLPEVFQGRVTALLEGF